VRICLPDRPLDAIDREPRDRNADCIALRTLSIAGFFRSGTRRLLNQHVWKLFNPVLLPPPHKV